MSPLMQRILKHSLIVAVILGGLGFGMSYALRMVMESQDVKVEDQGSPWLAAGFFAACGVGLLLVLELGAAFVRDRRGKPPNSPSPADDPPRS